MNRTRILEWLETFMPYGSDQKLLHGNRGTLSNLAKTIAGTPGFPYWTGDGRVMTPFGWIKALENKNIPDGVLMATDQLATELWQAHGVFMESQSLPTDTK